MATLTIRNLSEEELASFRVVAAEHGRSMEAEARQLIRSSLPCAPKVIRLSDAELPPVDPEIDKRIEEVHAMIRARLGELPKGRVDAFLAERRAAAARGE